MRKRIGIITVLLFVLLTVVYWQDISACFVTKYMQVKIADEAMLDGYTRVQDSERTSSIRFDGYEMAYDSAENIYYVAQNIDEGAWSGRFTVKDGKLFWQADAYWERFLEAVAEGHIFTLYHVDEENYLLYSYQIVFTGMPVMTLSLDGYDEVSEEFRGSMVTADPYAEGEKYRTAECIYHVRGGSSRNYQKKSYKLELEEDLSLLGMRKDDDWILNALYDDAGLIHNKFSIDVWRNIAAGNSVANDEGVRAEYVELFMDDEYMGVYALTERIDKKELNLSQGSILYKCFSWEIPERDNREEDYGFGKSFEIKYPDPYTRDAWNPLRQYADAFWRKGSISMQEADNILNLENAVDYNIFMLLSYGCDNLRKNTYFIAEPSYGGYRFKKVPWDMNATWGNAWVGEPKCNYTLYDPEAIYDTEMWSTDLFKLYDGNEEEVTALLHTRWQELRKDVLSEEELFKRLDCEFAYLHGSGAYDRNYGRWSNGTEYWEDSYIYEYVEGRLQFLDEYFEAPYFDSISEWNEGVR